MSFYTRIGTSLWSWEPWLALEHDTDDLIGCRARLLWLAFYTSPESKRIVPGLWHGSIATMADAARMSSEQALRALDRLIEHGLVEYDQKLRVVRLTKLPDAGESPQNGKVLRSWWTRFRSVPACAVRDAHVATLRWIMEEWSRETGKVLSADHVKAWSETFAQVTIPTSTPGFRSLFDHDTSTASQPSLFAPKASVDTVSKEVSTDPPVDNSDSVYVTEIRDPLTVSDNVGSGAGSGFGSSYPDPEQGGSGGGYGTSLPTPVLRVHPQIGFDADDFINMLAAATGGRFAVALTSEARAPIRAAIESAAELSRRPGSLDVLRDYIERGMPGFPRDHLSLEDRARNPGGISPAIVSSPGWLTFAIQRALTWKADADDKIAALAAARAEAGV